MRTSFLLSKFSFSLSSLSASFFSVAVLSTSLVLLSGCSPAVRTRLIGSSDAVSMVRRNIVTDGELSEETRQALRMQGIEEKAAIEKPSLLQSNPEFLNYLPESRIDFAASELAIAHALRHPDSPEALALYIQSAQYSLRGMTSSECANPVSLLCDNLKVFYLKSMVEVVRAASANKWGAGEIKAGDFTLQIAPATQFEDLKQYDSVVPAGLLSFSGLANRHVRFGAGLPLVACRKKNKDLPEDRYLPAVGTCLPVTAALDFEGNAAKLKLMNAFTTDTVTLMGKTLPLAANFSSPYAAMIEKTGMTDFSGMFSAFDGSEKLLQRTGFYTAEPYDSGKIPLLTVHGLFSSPITWIGVQNDLMGDPEIRKHFQIWNYLYPTNLPIVVNARTFREKLDELEAHLSATSPTKKGLRDMVIIAHSMGGILTKTAVVADSSGIKSFLFADPARLNSLDAETRAEYDSYLNFSCKPYIARVIFVAVPFRGSGIADNWVGWIGRKLISLPSLALKTPSMVANKLKSFVRPDLASDFESTDFTSVGGLSPKNPILLALSQVPIDQEVPYHCIVGDRGLGGGKDASDGVVPYTSAHLEGAQSELIVPADHTAHAHPRAVQEIKRILHLHLQTLEEEQKKAAQAKKQPVKMR